MLVVALRAIPRGRYAAVLFVLLGLVILRSFIGAHVLGTWCLENAPVAIGVIFFALSYRGMPLSRISYSLIFCSIACTRPARTGPTLGCLTMSGGGRSPAWPATPNPG